MSAFINSLGRSISDLPGYKDLHPKKTAKDHDSQYLSTEDRATYYQFLKDAFEYGMMVDHLNSAGVYGPWERALDIGGAEATVSRLLKTEGLARDVACVDIKDFSRTLPDALYWKFLLRFKAQSKLHKSRYRTSPLLNAFPQHFGYHPKKGDKFWNLSLKNKGKLNHYYTDDFYKLSGQYDFVSSLLSLPYFHHVPFFRKVRDLLAPGGVFYLISDYWWWPVNSSGIVGGFPYACQRLSREDLFRYFDEFFPAEAELVRERSKYFNQGHPPPTLDDLVRLAHDEGFMVLAANRHLTVEPDLDRTFMTPEQIGHAPGDQLAGALKDVRALRGDVQALDLETAFISLVLKRR